MPSSSDDQAFLRELFGSSPSYPPSTAPLIDPVRSWEWPIIVNSNLKRRLPSFKRPDTPRARPVFTDSGIMWLMALRDHCDDTTLPPYPGVSPSDINSMTVSGFGFMNGSKARFDFRNYPQIHKPGSPWLANVIDPNSNLAIGKIEFECPLLHYRESVTGHGRWDEQWIWDLYSRKDAVTAGLCRYFRATPEALAYIRSKDYCLPPMDEASLDDFLLPVELSLSVQIIGHTQRWIAEIESLVTWCEMVRPWEGEFAPREVNRNFHGCWLDSDLSDEDAAILLATSAPVYVVLHVKDPADSFLNGRPYDFSNCESERPYLTDHFRALQGLDAVDPMAAVLPRNLRWPLPVTGSHLPELPRRIREQGCAAFDGASSSHIIRNLTWGPTLGTWGYPPGMFAPVNGPAKTLIHTLKGRFEAATSNLVSSSNPPLSVSTSKDAAALVPPSDPPLAALIGGPSSLTPNDHAGRPKPPSIDNGRSEANGYIFAFTDTGIARNPSIGLVSDDKESRNEHPAIPTDASPVTDPLTPSSTPSRQQDVHMRNTNPTRQQELEMTRRNPGEPDASMYSPPRAPLDEPGTTPRLWQTHTIGEHGTPLRRPRIYPPHPPSHTHHRGRIQVTRGDRSLYPHSRSPANEKGPAYSFTRTPQEDLQTRPAGPFARWDKPYARRDETRDASGRSHNYGRYAQDKYPGPQRRNRPFSTIDPSSAAATSGWERQATASRSVGWDGWEPPSNPPPSSSGWGSVPRSEIPTSDLDGWGLPSNAPSVSMGRGPAPLNPQAAPPHRSQPFSPLVGISAPTESTFQPPTFFSSIPLASRITTEHQPTPHLPQITTGASQLIAARLTIQQEKKQNALDKLSANSEWLLEERLQDDHTELPPTAKMVKMKEKLSQKRIALHFKVWHESLLPFFNLPPVPPSLLSRTANQATNPAASKTARLMYNQAVVWANAAIHEIQQARTAPGAAFTDSEFDAIISSLASEPLLQRVEPDLRESVVVPVE